MNPIEWSELVRFGR